MSAHDRSNGQLQNSKSTLKPILTPAAQYVRMSDDLQQFSIQNQKLAIAEYAKEHGFEIIKTYEDSGKSGLAMKHRVGLSALIQDVVSCRSEYKAILVYDPIRG